LLIVSLAIDWLLFGIFLVQMVHWFSYVREDKKFIKTIVVSDIFSNHLTPSSVALTADGQICSAIAVVAALGLYVHRVLYSSFSRLTLTRSITAYVYRIFVHFYGDFTVLLAFDCS
jgi:hypothetical protein